MSIDPEEFFEIANACLGDTEISMRNSASRAYYAAYHASLPLADGLPRFADIRGGMHRQHIESLKSSSDLAVKGIALKLNECLNVRHIADYQLTDEFDSDTVKQQLRIVEKILERIDRLSSNSSASSSP